MQRERALGYIVVHTASAGRLGPLGGRRRDHERLAGRVASPGSRWRRAVASARLRVGGLGCGSTTGGTKHGAGAARTKRGQQLRGRQAAAARLLDAPWQRRCRPSVRAQPAGSGSWLAPGPRLQRLRARCARCALQGRGACGRARLGVRGAWPSCQLSAGQLLCNLHAAVSVWICARAHHRKISGFFYTWAHCDGRGLSGARLMAPAAAAGRSKAERVKGVMRCGRIVCKG